MDTDDYQYLTNRGKLTLAGIKGVLCGLSLLFVTLTLTGCTPNNGNTDSYIWYPLNEPIPSLRHYYNEAITEARTWHMDAALYWAEVWIRDGRTHMIYKFKSEMFPQERILVELEITPEGNVMKTFDSIIEGPSPVDPLISLDDSILDSAEVVDLALSFGARDFISNHPNVENLLIQLAGTSGAAAEELGIDPEIIVKALVRAKDIRPERHTILNNVNLGTQSAKDLAQCCGVM